MTRKKALLVRHVRCSFWKMLSWLLLFQRNLWYFAHTSQGSLGIKALGEMYNPLAFSRKFQIRPPRIKSKLIYPWTDNSFNSCYELKTKRAHMQSGMHKFCESLETKSNFKVSQATVYEFCVHWIYLAVFVVPNHAGSKTVCC